MLIGGIDGFNVWSAAYLGGLSLIAGTVIRSGGCALSLASPWLCCFEPRSIVSFSERASCGSTGRVS